MTNHFKYTIKSILTYKITPLIICGFVLVGFLISVNKAGSFTSEQNLEVLEKSINEAVVSCYAIEGRYPKDIEYLEDNYNLYINREKYLVDYDIFASNIMPDVVVIDKAVFE